MSFYKKNMNISPIPIFLTKMKIVAKILSRSALIQAGYGSQVRLTILTKVFQSQLMPQQILSYAFSWQISCRLYLSLLAYFARCFASLCTFLHGQ